MLTSSPIIGSLWVSFSRIEWRRHFPQQPSILHYCCAKFRLDWLMKECLQTCGPRHWCSRLPKWVKNTLGFNTIHEKPVTYNELSGWFRMLDTGSSFPSCSVYQRRPVQRLPSSPCSLAEVARLARRQVNGFCSPFSSVRHRYYIATDYRCKCLRWRSNVEGSRTGWRVQSHCTAAG